MSYSISHSTRTRSLFVVTDGIKETEAEFPLKEGFKHLTSAKAGRYSKWVPRIVTKSTYNTNTNIADKVAQEQMDFYKDQLT